MASKGRGAIASDITNEFPTNGNQEITATRLRDFFTTIKDSFLNLIDDNSRDISFSSAGFSSSNVGDAIEEAKAGQLKILWTGILIPTNTSPTLTEKYKSDNVSSITLTSTGSAALPKSRLVVNGTGIDYSKFIVSWSPNLRTDTTGYEFRSFYTNSGTYLEFENWYGNDPDINAGSIELIIYQAP